MNEWSQDFANKAAIDEFCVFVARRPICDRRQQAFGYELLFRRNLERQLSRVGDFASRRVIDVSVAYGLQTLVGPKAAFIDCTNEVIYDGLATLLPSTTVLQLEGKGKITRELIDACKQLSADGYRIALRAYGEEWDPLLPYLNFIKMDFSNTRTSTTRLLRNPALRSRIKFVAENVETNQDLIKAGAAGYDYFQGDFLGAPHLLARDGFATTLNRIRFLDELRRPELDCEKIILRLKEEPSLSLRLLRLANSALVSANEPIHSIRMAFLLVGERQFRRLAQNAFSMELFDCLPEKHLAVLRTARFCELMATPCGLDPDVMYFFGMLSVALTFLGLQPAAVESAIKVVPEVLNALSGVENIYTRVLRCSDTYQRGNWSQFVTALEELGPAGEFVTQNCIEAQRWADEALVNSY